MTSIESPLERQVRQEQTDHDAALLDGLDNDDTTDDAPLEDEGGQTTIIDRSAYEREDLQIPKIDGQTVDRIALKFAGTVFLERSDPSDVAVYNELRFGRDVALLIEAKCLGVGASGATNKDGNLDVVVSTKGLKVHSISKPAGADWVQEASA